ncbi:MAG TPA: hypothetical protein VFT35_07090 [Gaiellaceae bacterium]|jgi:hypothetical protein|nr:hypothetical protein [Gaiellaceae bacterium]
MAMEPISPELALVDPDLDARARALLPDPIPPLPFPRAADEASSPSDTARPHRAYPFWARVTAAMWLVVLGILIGGAAIPHAQDTPRVLPKGADARFCEAPPVQLTPPGQHRP